MTTFFLVRHGETTGEAGDAPLVASGFAQARAVGRALATRPIERVYASPLRRTRDTAAIIAEAVGVEGVDVDERLRERANWGDVAGQSWDEFVMLWERSNEDRDFVVPGGVSATEAGKRAVGFVRDVVRELPAAEVVAVAHGGVIVDLLVELFGEAELLRRNPELRHMGWCAVTELALESEDPTLRRLADWAP